MITALLRLFVTIFVLTAMGCASGARVANMIPSNFPEVKKQYPSSVRVQSAGGRETEWWGSSQISDESFQEALYQSLSKSGIFRQVVKEGRSNYLLDVFISGVKQPLMGFNMTVSVTANWKLIDLSNNRTVFEELIPTPYEAKVSDSFVGSERLRLANEGAVRENIKHGIQKLADLQLEH